MDGMDANLIPQEYLDLLHPSSVRAIEIKLAHTPLEDREDVLQEAMLAFVQGRSPADGATAEERRVRKHRQRFIPISQLLPD